MKEADLYPPVKAYLEAQGFEVKAEVGALDVMARRAGHAIQQALELAGPGAVVLSCLELGEW